MELMYNTPDNPAIRLRIWQQNLNTSQDAQHCVLSGPDTARNWDIVAIQEPTIDAKGNTRATPDWHVVYPSLRFTNTKRSRAVTLVHKRLNTNNWRQLPFPSSDVVVIQFTGAFGELTLFNIYNDGEKQDTPPTLSHYLEANIRTVRPTTDSHVIWLGDINCHHALWEEERNRHLCEPRAAQTHAQAWIELMAEYGMCQALPKDKPTLQSTNTGNWTRPDNVFCTDHTLDSFIICDTAPRLRAPKTDHVPILSTLDLDIPRATITTSYNYRDVDWEKLSTHLEERLQRIPPPQPIIDLDSFRTAAKDLATALHDVIEDQVPKSKPNPHAKRWWTKEISQMLERKHELSALSYKFRQLQDHPSHEEHRKFRNRVSETIYQAKKEHWIQFLEEASQREIWIANKYVTSPSSDGSKARIPVLHTKDPNGSITEAITNDEKSALLAETFFPPPPLTSSVPEDFAYPDPVTPFEPITEEHVERAIKNTSPYKAPGPDGICNIVFKRNITVLTPYLTHLFNATMTLRTYYEPWRDFTTIVLRKPGKADYSVPKAYRPIALINTTCKLLTAIITQQVTHILEAHHLLPANHFGGRPGRSTTDSVHLLEAAVKDAWRSGKVASALFLDIEGAFPNAVTDRLIHNMKRRRLPEELVSFTERMLTGRRTQLKFDDFTSEWFPVNNGIGQGDPLSMICYLIYNSDLVEVAKGKIGNRQEEIALAFVDDTAFIAIADSFEATHAILKDMLEREGGGYQWSREHNSRFETSKFALMDFTRSKLKTRIPIILNGISINPAHHTRFLGIIVDQELTWKEHAAYAIAKGTEYALQIRRLSRTAMGIPTRLMRQLYQSVAIPKFTYGADIWFCPLFKRGTNGIQRGSKGIADRLTSVQRIAAISITGAMRTTPTDSMEAHANLLPIPLLIQRICHRAAVRLATLPQSHPLHKKLIWIANHNVQSHRSSLHNLIHSFRTFPNDIETVDPTRRTRLPKRGVYKTNIAKSKKEAIRTHNELTDTIRIYTDGSGHNGGIGAAAILIREGQEPRILRYHLGSDEEHTVYEAETLGLTLATQLLATERNVTYPASILIDNQAAIQCGDTANGEGSGYLAKHFDKHIRRIAALRETHHDFDLTLRWIPGHEGINGNELVDGEAKKAAEGPHQNSPTRRLPKYLRGTRLLCSAPALRAAQKIKTKQMWTAQWKKSPRYARTSIIDASMPSGKYIKLTNGLNKRTSSMYIQLRTRHIPLNLHLHRIQKSDSPHCPICPGTNETIYHFLFDCPQYRQERHIFANAVKRNATSIAHILTSDKTTPHLLRFINNTERFKPTFGKL